MSDLHGIIHLLRGDFTAVRNRLYTASEWRNLTDGQREAIESARRRSALGLSRLDAITPPAPDPPPITPPPPDPPPPPVPVRPTLERPYPEHPVHRPIPDDARDWSGAGAVAITPGLHFDFGYDSPGVWPVGIGVEYTLVIVGREVRVIAPETIRVGAGSDRPLVLIDVRGGLEYRLWRAEIIGRRVTCENGNILELGTGRKLHGGNVTGSGLSYTKGLLRPYGVRDGIDHALRISASYIGAPHVLPALHSDQRGEAPPKVPMGARLYLPRSVDLGPILERIRARLPNPLHQRLAVEVARALQRYGATYSDGGGFPHTVYCEGASADWVPLIGEPTGTYDGHPTYNAIGRAINAELPWALMRITDDPRLGS